MIKPSEIKNSSEAFEFYDSSVYRGKMCEYNYRASDGRLFTTVMKTLKKCRQKKDVWLRGNGLTA
jgi:hypothetical protein